MSPCTHSVACVLTDMNLESEYGTSVSCGNGKLRQWLIDQIDSGKYQGLVWESDDKTIFRIPWKHAGKQDYNRDEDAALFKVWPNCNPCVQAACIDVRRSNDTACIDVTAIILVSLSIRCMCCQVNDPEKMCSPSWILSFKGRIRFLCLVSLFHSVQLATHYFMTRCYDFILTVLRNEIEL